MASRTINPRSGSGLYVDLITNQSIAGIKRFLNNFITNADINFNTNANIGRVVFNPNEPFGSGSQIVSIYTEDEVDGQGWIFDSAGNLYYIGTGIAQIKISFAPNGNITSLGNLECQGITANSIVNTFSDVNLYNVGSKRFIFKPSASSTNPILSIFTVSDVDGKGWVFDASGNFYYTGVAPNPKILFEPNGAITSLNSITAPTITASTSFTAPTITASTSFNSDLITAINGTATKNSIMMNNNFFNVTNGSIDLKAHYVGFPYITQSLDLTSKYMAIRPLSDGNFQIEINNIASKVLHTNWSTLTLTSDFNLALGSKTITTTGAVSTGAITCTALNASSGIIQTTGAINGATITASTSFNSNLILATTGSTKNSIQMENKFFNASNGSIDLKAHYVGFPYITQSLDLTSKYMAIVPESDGNFSMQINNVVGKLLYTEWTNKFINTDWTFKWYNSAGFLKASIFSNGEINGTSITISGGGIISTSGTLLCGPASCQSLNANGGNIQTTGGAITCGTLTTTGNISTALGTIQTGGSLVGPITKVTTLEAILLNTYRNKIQMSNLFFNESVASMDLVAQYIGFAHPAQTLALTSKYFFINPMTTGDVGFGINNISGYFLYTDWANKRVTSEYTFGFRTAPFSSGYRYQTFLNNVTEIGSVSMLTGSTIAFNNSSDYRLKQDIKPIQNPLERLLKLKPKNYRFIADVEDESCCECYFDGFLAHEVQEVLPMIVTGKKDDPNQMQQMDYSKLTPICVGAIQEVNEKIDKMQLIIDAQQKMIEMLMSRLDNVYKDSSSLATSDNVIGGGGSTSIGGETSGTTSTCDAETSTCGSISDL